ncbi:MAG: tripartite tricarboxylate transporter substrate binding protein [Betaproteobacteria bacterium]|nr:tripartite tricarboxylate transporter substrate binding protein [Betaproteobacteria bacterium]
MIAAITRKISGGMLIVSALVSATLAGAQDYPARAIKFVVPSAPGTGVDSIARLVAEKLQAKWGQPVVVDNRAGAGLNIGAEYVAKASPDGYTLLYTPPPPLVINKTLYARLNYDPDGFVPVSLVSSTPLVLVVPPKQAAESLQQLIAYAKANPDRLNYASAGSGSTLHLAAELFKSMAGVKVVHVPYKVLATGLTDLIGGQVDMVFFDLGTVFQHIRAGRLKVLGIGSEKRHPLLPGVPAVAEVLPGYAAATWNGIVAPAGTPPALVNRLAGAVAEVMKLADVVEQLSSRSTTAIGSTPAEMSAFMAQERERWGGVIRASGARAD